MISDFVVNPTQYIKYKRTEENAEQYFRELWLALAEHIAPVLKTAYDAGPKMRTAFDVTPEFLAAWDLGWAGNGLEMFGEKQGDLLVSIAVVTRQRIILSAERIVSVDVLWAETPELAAKLLAEIRTFVQESMPDMHQLRVCYDQSENESREVYEWLNHG